MAIYRARFALLAPVNDFAAAQSYLTSDDMTCYLRGEVPTVKDEEIRKVEWRLDDDQTGYVECEFTRELTPDELEAVSDWIRGQNSDGLGEGFEQQDFAQAVNPDACCDCEFVQHCSDDPETCGADAAYAMAEFDWKTNHYHLSQVA